MHLHALTEPITSNYSVESKNSIATGYLSDAVLKGSRVPKKKFFKRLGLDIKKRDYGAKILAKNKLKIFKPNLIDRVNFRRQNLRKIHFFKNLPLDHEIFGYVPFSAYKSSPFSSGQRRFLSLYEPFASNKCLR